MNSTNDTGIPILAFSDHNYVLPLVILASIAIGSVLLHLLLFLLLKKIAQDTGWTFDAEVVKHCFKPAFFVFPLASIFITLSFVTGDQDILAAVRHALEILLIFFITWTVNGIVKAWEITTDSNNSNDKRSKTELVVASRILHGLVSALGVASIFLTFPSAWELGASLLASASVIAVLIGFAAKSSLENLAASLHIALTQPILLGDYVAIDDYCGVVEEIQAQFLVIKNTEEKRLIVPLSRIVNKSFENWSRNGERKFSYFYLYVDYGIPLEDLRKQFVLNVHKSEYWDHREASLNIYETKETVMILEVMMTASNVRNAENLKFEIREKLVEYMVTTYPQYLPRARNEYVPSREGTDSMKKIVAKMDEASLDDDELPDTGLQE